MGHAIFSSTAAVIQTALVLSSSHSSAPFDAHRAGDSLLYDGRLRPAYYIIAIAAMSYLALTVGVNYNKRKRLEEEEKTSKIIPSAPTLASDYDEDDDKIPFTDRVTVVNGMHNTVSVTTSEEQQQQEGAQSGSGGRGVNYHSRKYHVVNQQYSDTAIM